MGIKSTLLFRFLRNPHQVGAVWESSKHLAKAITEDVGIEKAHCVVELGPGNGALTRGILPRLGDNSRFLAVELDETLCKALVKRYPQVDVHCGNATELPTILLSRGVTHTNTVISGLPWAIFPEELQRALLEAVVASLTEDGCFTTFAYLQGVLMPAGRKFRMLLNEYFEEIERRPIIWRNSPPAFTYCCRYPKKK